MNKLKRKHDFETSEEFEQSSLVKDMTNAISTLNQEIHKIKADHKKEIKKINDDHEEKRKKLNGEINELEGLQNNYKDQIEQVH